MVIRVDIMEEEETEVNGYSPTWSTLSFETASLHFEHCQLELPPSRSTTWSQKENKLFKTKPRQKPARHHIPCTLYWQQNCPFQLGQGTLKPIFQYFKNMDDVEMPKNMSSMQQGSPNVYRWLFCTFYRRT